MTPGITQPLSRRALLGAACACWAAGPDTVVDIHQHTVYGPRGGEQLVAHQRAMGVTKTVLLPVGTRPGLKPGDGGNQSAIDLAHKYPKEFVFFANAVPGDPNAQREIEKLLRAGALGVGEQKYGQECDSEPMQKLYAIAQEHRIPVLLHFQHGAFNMGIERFHKMAEKYPRAKFIGHAQTWWGNIDRNHDQKVLYPKRRCGCRRNHRPPAFRLRQHLRRFFSGLWSERAIAGL